MLFLKRFLIPFGISIALVILIDILTNAVTPRRLYDSNIYIGMAERGFAPDVLISPFVYRFIPPFLAGSLHQFAGLSIYKSFKLITYVGLISQLFGVFLLVRYIAKSEKAAFMGMLAVAFSLYNVKYPLFDVHRPDNLAYPVVLSAAWLAIKDYFVPLLLTTMIGLQLREFAIVPLLAFLGTKLHQGFNKAWIGSFAISMIVLLIAIGVPRWIIPVTEHAEAVELSSQGPGQLIYLLSLWPRNINIIYIVFAYFLPFLVLYRRSQLKNALREIPVEQVGYLAYYSGFVFILVVIGGTDLERFATYFFLPLAVLTGLLAKDQPWMKLLLVLVIQIIFNRIWLPFPVWDLDLMVDFYAGWSNVINTASLWRFAELIILMVIGNLLTHARIPFIQETLSEIKEK